MKKIYTFTFILLSLIFTSNVHGQSYNFDAITSGSTGVFSNGWIGSPTTGYSWIADAAGTTSGGTGPAVDHTLGTASGIYVYVEASTPAGAGDTAALISPNITLTGPNPGLSFWYHRAGTSMGNMYIDVYNGTSWVLGVDSLVGSQQAVETDPWLNKVVNLSAFSGTIKVKFRAVWTTSWSGDMAIDDVSMVQVNPYDANLMSVIPSSYYYMFPMAQVQPMGFSGVVKNEGADSITNVTINALVNNTTSLSGSIPTLYSSVIDTIPLATSYTPSSIGLYYNEFNVSISETDSVPINDSAIYMYEVTDTIYARENDNVTLGIGFTGGTGVFGQMFEVFNSDSLTSVTFKLTSPTISDYIKMKLYGWNTTANTPGTIIDSTDNFSIPSDSNMWYTLQFTCDRILAPGKYFFAVEQLAINNLSMGYTDEFYEPGVTWYNSGAAWTSFESAGFQVSLAIRPNFGPASWPSVNLGSDTGYCANSSLSLSVPSGWSSYLWDGGSTTNSTTVSTADSTFWVQVKDARGCAASDTIIISEYPEPQIMLAGVTGMCDGVPVTLVANNDPLLTYLWSDGSIDSTLVVTVAGNYNVTVTNALGCSNTGFTFVQVGTTPVAQISVDTAYYCAGSSVTVTAAGSGNLYTWSNGTNGNTVQINSPGIFMVTVSSPQGCTAYDTAFAVESPIPNVVLSDTALVFCDNDLGNVSVNSIAGATYLWSDGGTSSFITLTAAGTYSVTVTKDGCSSSAGGSASTLPSPVVDLGMDTSICDTATLILDAGSATSWLWSTGATTQTISVNSTGNYAVEIESSNGCKDTDTVTVTVEVCVGINELNGNGVALSAFPNPATNSVTVEFGAELLNSEITVVDTKGTIVFQGVVTESEKTIDVSKWSTGVYHLSVIHEEIVYRARIIVKK